MDSGYLRELLDDAERDIESLTKERDEWKRRAESLWNIIENYPDLMQAHAEAANWFEREE